ncbi:MAG: EVE domain-containing protein [Gammaproteobacteria bacterium RIFCSPLOWO2_12_47_11]|nr:MAG: EVE domain-containing protein [Gammaproteobacteria bacterium RIFCSPLOWO2_12_47_11]
MNYWLMKSEPDVFSIDDLKNRPKQTEPWDGVRNYQARNMLRDDMKKDDLALFYHSSCEVTGIVGIMEIVKEGYPDPTAFIPKHKYYDPKSKPEKPTWYLVDVKFKRKLKRTIPLIELRDKKPLQKMHLLQKGNRLSVMPVTKKEWEYILSLE